MHPRSETVSSPANHTISVNQCLCLIALKVLLPGDWPDPVTSALMCLGVNILDKQALLVGDCVATQALTHKPVLSGMLEAISLALVVPRQPIAGQGAASSRPANPQLARDNVTTAAACLNNDERRLLRSQFLQSKWFTTGGKPCSCGWLDLPQAVYIFSHMTQARLCLPARRLRP